MNPMIASLRKLIFCITVLATAGACAQTRHEASLPAETEDSAVSTKEALKTDGTKAGQKRAIAREIRVTMRAKSPSDVALEITKLAEAQGGYVVNSSITAAAPGSTRADLSLRVPATQIEPLLTHLRKLGEIRDEIRKGDDVTSEVVDTEARLTARRALESRLLELLSSAKSIEDMLKVETELSRVRTEVEQLVGQARTLSQRTEFALLQVIVESPDALRASEEPFVSRLGNACRSAVSTSQSVILGFVEFLGIVIPLVALAALIWLPIRSLRRRIRRLKAKKAESALEQSEGKSSRD